MSQIVLSCLLFLFAGVTPPQDDSELTTTKSFLIIQSTRSYDAALRKAQLACNKLGLPLDLRGMFKNKEGGLTSNNVCGCGQKHGYMPRGRYDDGQYISIEYSTSYLAFTPGYYMVIVASGKREKLDPLLPDIRAHYKDAYIKNSEVYMGCMH